MRLELAAQFIIVDGMCQQAQEVEQKTKVKGRIT